MKKIYLAIRLFNVNDRIASIDLADTVDSWIDEGTLTGIDHCYLPYRDSNNSIDPNEPNINLAIFEKDLENIQNSPAVAGYLDGPTYDSGMGFEIGYSYTLGNPITFVTTDYFTQTVGDESGGQFIVSKLMDHIAVMKQVDAQDPAIEDYTQASIDLRNRAKLALKDSLVAVLENGEHSTEEIEALKQLDVEYDYYIDPNFSYTEAGRLLLSEILGLLEKHGKTFVMGNNKDDIFEDLQNLAKSEKSLFYSDDFDANIDSNILQGISYGLGREPVLYSSKKVWYATGSDNYGYFKNVMVRYSAKYFVQSMDEFETVLDGTYVDER